MRCGATRGWFAKAVPTTWLFPPLSSKVMAAEVTLTSMLKWDVLVSKLNTRPNTVGVSRSFTHTLTVCSDASRVPEPLNFQ